MGLRDQFAGPLGMAAFDAAVAQGMSEEQAESAVLKEFASLRKIAPPAKHEKLARGFFGFEKAEGPVKSALRSATQIQFNPKSETLEASMASPFVHMARGTAGLLGADLPPLFEDAGAQADYDKSKVAKGLSTVAEMALDPVGNLAGAKLGTFAGRVIPEAVEGASMLRRIMTAAGRRGLEGAMFAQPGNVVRELTTDDTLADHAMRTALFGAGSVGLGAAADTVGGTWGMLKEAIRGMSPEQVAAFRDALARNTVGHGGRPNVLIPDAPASMEPAIPLAGETNVMPSGAPIAMRPPALPEPAIPLGGMTQGDTALRIPPTPGPGTRRPVIALPPEVGAPTPFESPAMRAAQEAANARRVAETAERARLLAESDAYSKAISSEMPPKSVEPVSQKARVRRTYAEAKREDEMLARLRRAAESQGPPTVPTDYVPPPADPTYIGPVSPTTGRPVEMPTYRSASGVDDLARRIPGAGPKPASVTPPPGMVVDTRGRLVPLNDPRFSTPGDPTPTAGAKIPRPDTVLAPGMKVDTAGRPSAKGGRYASGFDERGASIPPRPGSGGGDQPPGPWGKPKEQGMLTRMMQAAREGLRPMRGADAEVASAARTYRGATELMDRELGFELTQKMKTTTPEVRREVYDALTGSKSPGKLSPEARNLHDDFFARKDAQGQEAVRLGLIDEATYQAHKNEYIRRVYLNATNPKEWRAQMPEQIWEDAKQSIIKDFGIDATQADRELERMLSREKLSLTRPNGEVVNLQAGPLEHRANVPPEIRRFLGEVKDGVFASVRTLMDVGTAIEQKKLFDRITVELPRINREALRRGEPLRVFKPEYASEMQRKVFGDIYGKEMPSSTVSLLEDVFSASNHLKSYMQEAIDGTVRAAKYSKVLMNPQAYFNSFLGNPVKSFLADVTVANPMNAKYYWDSFQALRGSNKALQNELVKHGGFSAGFVGNDYHKALVAAAGQVAKDVGGKNASISQLMREVTVRMEKWLADRKLPMNAGELLGWTDNLFRGAMYLKGTRGTISLGTGIGTKSKVAPEEMARYVNEFFPNYDEASAFGQAVRRDPTKALVANPFTLFSVEDIRTTANAIYRQPGRAAGLASALGLVATQLGWKMTRANDDTIKQIEDAKSRNPMKSVGMVLPIPGSASWNKGTPQTLDATKYVPIVNQFQGAKVDAVRPWYDQAMGLLLDGVKNQALGGFVVSAAERAKEDPLYEGPATTAAKQVGEVLGPAPLVNTIARVRQAARGGTNFYDEKMTVPKEVLRGITGIRVDDATPERFGKVSDVELKKLKKSLKAQMFKNEAEYEKKNLSEEDYLKRKQELESYAQRLFEIAQGLAQQ